MSNKMVEFARRLAELKDKKAALETSLKDVNRELKSLTETEIPEYMDDNEIDKITVEGLGTVYVQQKLYASVLAGDRPALYEHLRETGNEDLIQDWVFPATLTAFCKEQLENGKPVPEMVKATKIPTAILRRS